MEDLVQKETEAYNATLVCDKCNWNLLLPYVCTEHKVFWSNLTHPEVKMLDKYHTEQRRLRDKSKYGGELYKDSRYYFITLTAHPTDTNVRENIIRNMFAIVGSKSYTTLGYYAALEYTKEKTEHIHLLLRIQTVPGTDKGFINRANLKKLNRHVSASGAVEHRLVDVELCKNVHKVSEYISKVDVNAPEGKPKEFFGDKKSVFKMD